ncbi:MAG TPA: hypothetical protein VKS24_04025 [Bradyrhizobium sp.]|nr:hypothetical protein [Bradyrhizobium sp.]
MWIRWICVAAFAAALFSATLPQAEAAERSGVFHRASCSLIRFYVAKYSADAAEAWARSHGATEAEIETARRCLPASPVQSASVVGVTAR